MKVLFKDVGRGKQTWIADLRSIERGDLLRSVRSHSALKSREIDFDLTDEANGVILVGGFRAVGTFAVLDTDSEHVVSEIAGEH